MNRFETFHSSGTTTRKTTKTTTSKIKAKVVNSLFINSDLIACIDDTKRRYCDMRMMEACMMRFQKCLFTSK